MKKSPLLQWTTFCAVVLFLTQLAPAQTTFVGSTNATSQWTNTAVWSGGSVPNATDATVVFTNVVTNTGVVWSNTNITVGTFNFNNASGSVVIGDNSITNDTLTMATSTGKPVFNVTNNNGTAFIYATLLGTNGFTKTGAGNLTFRFNATAMTYTGDINLNAGTLTINQDTSLGDTNNDIFVGGNSTLSYSPGSNTGAGTLSAGRNISISNGTTLNLQTLNTNTPLTVNGVISNAGALTFVGTASGSNAATSLSYTLNGLNTYSGQTTIQGGSRVTLGSGGSLGSGALSLSGGNGLAWNLNLGGNTQNVANFAPASSTANVRTFGISNGILNVTNASGAFVFNGTNGTTLDMSNLTTFTWGGLTNRNFTITPDTSGSATNNTNTVYFARSSNQITGAVVTVGGATGTSQGGDHAARVFLGTNNAFNATSVNIGGFNGTGSIAFMGNVTNGSVKLRGTNGTGALPLLVVGNTSSGSRRGSGAFDLGIADALVTDTIIGNFQANSVTNLTVSNSITMAGGTFDSANIYLGSMTNSAGVGNVVTNISTFQQSGGTSSVTLLRMGDNRATDAGNTIAFQSTYSLIGSGAVLRAQTIDAGTNGLFGANASRTLAMSNGATLRNASGANLSVAGYDATGGGRMNVALVGNGTVEADGGQSVTFGANTRLSGSGALTKIGSGTLILSSGIANANTGALNVNAGVVSLAGSGVASAGSVSSLAVATNATLLISQSDQVNNSAGVTLSGGTISRAGGVSEVFGALTVTGSGFLDYGTGLTGTLSFGNYTPSSLLSIQNFGDGNVLTFGTDLSSTINDGGLFAFDNSFTSSWNSGTSTFTITAIPEPATVVAAAGLLGLLLWPVCRRLRP